MHTAACHTHGDISQSLRVFAFFLVEQADGWLLARMATFAVLGLVGETFVLFLLLVLLAAVSDVGG